MATQSNYAEDRQRDTEGASDNELHKRRIQSFPQEGSLRYLTCNCGAWAEEIIYAAMGERTGWYCVDCSTFYEASEPHERKL
jgi:hypothetical protein